MRPMGLLWNMPCFLQNEVNGDLLHQETKPAGSPGRPISKMSTALHACSTWASSTSITMRMGLVRHSGSQPPIPNALSL